jgi:hypothetical protein
MKATKVLNYIAGVIAIIHAGTSSFFNQQVYQLPDMPATLDNYTDIMNFANTLPTSYFIITSLFLLTGTLLFIFGIVTLILNLRLSNQLRIKRLAVMTSFATIIGVFIGLIVVANTIHAVLLSILYIIVGYFVH